MKSRRSKKESSNIFSKETLTDALKAIKNKDFPILGKHPLAALRLVRKQHGSTTSNADQASVGLTLRTILLNAIESLKPKQNDDTALVSPDTDDKESVYHIILRERFVNGLSVSYIARFLTLSRRQYFREQNQAIMRLGAILREWEYELPAPLALAEPMRHLSWEELELAADNVSQGFLESTKSKYDPHLYFQRQTLLHHFQDFLSSNKSILMITGNSGAGKSSFLASLREEFTADDDLLFVMFNAVGLSVESGLVENLYRNLAYFLDLDMVDGTEMLANIDEIIGADDRKVIVVIDAINEHAEGSKLLYHIDQMASLLRYPWLKLVVSSRTEAWKVLKRPLTLAQEQYYQTNSVTEKPWYKPAELGGRLTRFPRQDLAQVYENYRQIYSLKSAYTDLNHSIKNALRDPLLLRLVSEVYAEKPMPQHIRVIDIYPAFINALIASHRLEDEDIIFLEQEIIPLMMAGGSYADKITEAQIRAAKASTGEPLWKYIVANQPAGWGQHTNDSFTRLVDAGILKYVDKVITFRYERFYDYYGGQQLYNQMRLKDVTRAIAYETLAEEAHDKAYLSGPMIQALGMELDAENTPLIVDLAQMSSPHLRDKLIAAITEYGLDNQEKAAAILHQLWQTGHSKRGDFARAREWLWDMFKHDAVSATCSASDYVIISVAARLQFQDLMEMMLTDWSPAVRAAATKQAFILWRHDNEAGFALLSNLAARILRDWRLPRPHILESIIGLSLAILFDAYHDPECVAKLRTLWKTIIEKLLYVNVDRLGKRPERFKNMLRTAVLNTSIGFVIKTAGETPDDTVLDVPELRLFFARDNSRNQRRETARTLCQFMDTTETAVSDLHEFSLELIEERDLFTAILAQTAWRRHVLANPTASIPLLTDLFDKAIEVIPPGPFSNMVPTFAIPLEDEFISNTGKEALSHMYATINQRAQGRWQGKQREQRWPGFMFYCMAKTGKARDIPLCPAVKQILTEMIANQDIDYINWVISEELRNALIELGYYQYGFAVLKMFVQEPEIINKPSTQKALIDLLSRVYVYEPELVENFLEVNHLVNEMGRAIKTNIPVETIGDLVNYRAAMFWYEVIVNKTSPEMWQSFIWIFNQISEYNRLESWAVNFFKFIVNKIYGEPIFYDIP